MLLRFFLLCFLCLWGVESAGVLRLRILNLQNLEGRTLNGQCCEKSDRKLIGLCQGSCRTFLRLCATTVGRHTQVDTIIQSRNARQSSKLATWRWISHNDMQMSDDQQLTNNNFRNSSETQFSEYDNSDPSSEFTRSRAVVTPACTIGSVITPPIFNNSLDPTSDGVLDVSFPFNSSWPGKVMLIVEAWHDVNNGFFNQQAQSLIKSGMKDVPALVARFKRIHYPTQIGKWSAAFALAPHVKVDYALRLDCQDRLGGPNCTQKTDGMTSSSRPTTGLNREYVHVGHWIAQKHRRLQRQRRELDLRRSFFLSGLGDAIGVTVDTLYALNTSIYYAAVVFKVLKYGVLFLNFFG